MTTTELGLALGVAQSMISRYESGRATPRAPVLLRLLRLAKGVEKNPILRQLSIIRGLPVEEREALREADGMIAEAAAIKQELQIMSDPRPNLARFAYLAPAILYAREEIDDSLNTILDLWRSTPEFPGKSQCFKDAARFLEIALDRASAESPGPKRWYKIVRPVDLGDGVRRKAGEFVELTVMHARRYMHSLREAEGKLARDGRKKRA
jgi:transcriptional regulator with XRE-family HTH domain